MVHLPKIRLPKVRGSEGLAHWWQTVAQHPVTPYVAALMVIFSVGLFVASQRSNNTASVVQSAGQVLRRLRHDEQIVCQVQNRQLPAGHALVKALQDLYVVVNVPLTPAERNQAARQGRQKQLAAYEQLGFDLGQFLAYVAQQPKSVSCPF